MILVGQRRPVPEQGTGAQGESTEQTQKSLHVNVGGSPVGAPASIVEGCGRRCHDPGMAVSVSYFTSLGMALATLGVVAISARRELKRRSAG